MYNEQKKHFLTLYAPKLQRIVVFLLLFSGIIFLYYMWYPITVPFVVKKWVYPDLLWNKNRSDKVLYLTFDDGPTPVVTPWVLEQLAQYNAKATFFCIGKNVEAQAQLFEQLGQAGHRIGNHTQHHYNGWQVPLNEYLTDIRQADSLIHSPLFRPPYGKITRQQIRLLLHKKNISNIQTIVMWDVLSGDFDEQISGEQCWQNVLQHTQNGTIVVFHDSQKAFPRLQYALPRTLEYFSAKGFRFETL